MFLYETDFYKEDLHEDSLPNKKGQYKNSLRFESQDRYGNELAIHKEQTYQGDVTTWLSHEELENNPKTIFNYLDNQIREFLERLPIIAPNINLNLDAIQVFIKRDYGHPNINRGNGVYIFEDDGDTRTEGFQYNIFWVLDLKDNRDLKYEVLNGCADSAIVFNLTFNCRIHDSDISSRFFSLYFYGISVSENPRKKVDCRIDYNNDNMTMNSIIKPENLFRLGKKIIEYNKDKELLTKALSAFSQ